MPVLPDLIESIMTTKVQTVGPSDVLKEALKKMVKKNIGSVVVVDGEKPVGIITERDISRNVAKGAKTLRTPVGRAMSGRLVSVSPNTPNHDAIEMMLRHGIRRLPVIEKEKLVGIVTERDLLRWVLQVTYEPDIPPEIKEILARPLAKV